MIPSTPPLTTTVNPRYYGSWYGGYYDPYYYGYTRGYYGGYYGSRYGGWYDGYYGGYYPGYYYGYAAGAATRAYNEHYYNNPYSHGARSTTRRASGYSAYSSVRDQATSAHSAPTIRVVCHSRVVRSQRLSPHAAEPPCTAAA